MHFIEDEAGVTHVRDADLVRAARHYRRAMDALGEATFESLSPVTTQKLRNHLMREMGVVTGELKRRGLMEDGVSIGDAMDQRVDGLVSQRVRDRSAVFS